MHCVSSLTYQTHTIIKRQCAGSSESGVLTKTVAGAETGIKTESFDGVQNHQAGHKSCQLRIARIFQLVGVCVKQ